jgi:hypothetical protein
MKNMDRETALLTKYICGPFSARAAQYPWTQTPFAMATPDDGRRLIATNGRLLLAFETEMEPTIAAGVREKVENVLNSARKAKPKLTISDDVAGILGAAALDFILDGERYVFDPIPRSVQGRVIDLWLIGRVIMCVGAGEIRIAPPPTAAGTPFRLDGDGWFALISPMEGDSTGCPALRLVPAASRAQPELST